MSLRAILGLLLLCGARRAWADRVVSVELDGRPPFAADELAAALRVRIGSGAPLRVRVRAIEGGVIVDARGGSRTVALGGRTGAEAARLVALAATDLVMDDLAIAPDPPPSPPGLTARVDGAAAVASPKAPLDAITFGVLGAAAAWDGVLGGVTVDIAVPRGRWIAAFDVGGAALGGGPVSLEAATLRLGGGVREGWIDLRAGVTLAPLIVSDGAGDQTVLAGVGASARVRIPVAANVRAVIAAGADAFATRTEYMDAGMTVATTPWLSPWIAAGVEITP